MRNHPRKLVLLITLTGLAFWVTSLSAHHGWDWAEDEQTEMRGVITEIYIGPPHPRLRMETEDGNWRVDLGNPRRTEEAGFVEGEAEEGDEVLIRGHRSRDDENVMKAVRATINDEHYTFYPERLED